jgi:hypothetical protein
MLHKLYWCGAHYGNCCYVVLIRTLGMGLKMKGRKPHFSRDVGPMVQRLLDNNGLSARLKFSCQVILITSLKINKH